MDVTTLAGGTEGHQDGQGAAARFSVPTSVACCPDGGAIVADAYGQRVRQVSAGGAVATVADIAHVPRAVGVEGRGQTTRFFGERAETEIRRFSSDVEGGKQHHLRIGAGASGAVDCPLSWPWTPPGAWDEAREKPGGCVACDAKPWSCSRSSRVVCF